MTDVGSFFIPNKQTLITAWLFFFLSNKIYIVIIISLKNIFKIWNIVTTVNGLKMFFKISKAVTKTQVKISKKVITQLFINVT